MNRKTFLGFWMVLMLCVCMLTSCGPAAQPAPEPAFAVSVDENGLATWKAFEGAAHYEYTFVDKEYIGMDSFTTEELSVVVPKGFSVHVFAVLANGEMGDVAVSEYYGEPAALSEFTAEELVLMGITREAADHFGQESAFGVVVDENGLATWNAVEGVMGYEYAIVDKEYTSKEQITTTALFVQLPEGFSVHVRPVYEDGQLGDVAVSDYYGEPVAFAELMPEEQMEFAGVDDERQEVRAFEVHMDADGVVAWEPCENAVAYEVTYRSNDVQGKSLQIKETSFRVPEHYSVEVRPVYADGTRGDAALSECYGEPLPLPEKIDLSLYSTYDFMAHLDRGSFVTDENGVSTFTAEGPEGQPMRFEARGISLTDAGILMAPGAKITALDAIGAIVDMHPAFDWTVGAEQHFDCFGEFSFDGAESVDSALELVSAQGRGMHVFAYENASLDMSTLRPNFISVGTSEFNSGDVLLTGMNVHYDPAEKVTAIRKLTLEAGNYGYYLAGEKYDLSKEGQFDFANQIYIFLLRAVMETPVANAREDAVIMGIDKAFFTVGDLKDAQGNVLDKETATVEMGTVLEVTISGRTFDVELPVVERFENARNMHELIPEVYPAAEGNFTALVVPIVWQDEVHTYDDETMLAFKAELGRVEDVNGVVTDHSANLADAERFALSEYYDIASYGKMNICSVMTDWYPAPYPFAEKRDVLPDEVFLHEVTEWLYITYPDMDWSRFDKDANGSFDTVIFLNAGGEESFDSYYTESFMGGINSFGSYIAEKSGSAFRPTINQYITAHQHLLDDNVLAHEFGHTLGLVDYYDVTYSGINAVGAYDMQSVSTGDWNAYSKYAAGWIDPIVVQGLAQGESIEITIGAMATTGDAIVIPAAQAQQDGTPFNEYVLIDLFSAEGVHVHDAKKYGMENEVGVRIYHVNAVMERRELTHEWAFGEMFPIGTVNKTNVHNPDGKYLIELIQSSGKNTFTDLAQLRTDIQPSDLFHAGDVFTAEGYDAFFKDGLMDDGLPFGYTVKIVSVDETAKQATVRITRN